MAVVANPVFAPYSLGVYMVTGTPGAGSLAGDVTISSSTSGASIRYTLDGSDPTSTTGTLYAGPIPVYFPGGVGISYNNFRAIAYKAGDTDSSIIRCSWTLEVVASPTPSVPVVTTQAVSSISGNTAIGNGAVTSDGGSAIIQRGVCWSTNSIPTISDYKAISSSQIGVFTVSMTNLAFEVHYYARAYATSALGTGYGSVVEFIIPTPPPELLLPYPIMSGSFIPDAIPSIDEFSRDELHIYAKHNESHSKLLENDKTNLIELKRLVLYKRTTSLEPVYADPQWVYPHQGTNTINNEFFRSTILFNLVPGTWYIRVDAVYRIDSRYLSDHPAASLTYSTYDYGVEGAGGQILLDGGARNVFQDWLHPTDRTNDMGSYYVSALGGGQYPLPKFYAFKHEKSPMHRLFGIFNVIALSPQSIYITLNINNVGDYYDPIDNSGVKLEAVAMKVV